VREEREEIRMREKERRGTAAKHQPRPYPQWGRPQRESNVRELYRYGEKGLLTRYIIPPADVVDKRRASEGKPLLGNIAYKLLRYGLAVEDVVIGLLGAGFRWLLSIPVGAGIDGYLEVMGW